MEITQKFQKLQLPGYNADSKITPKEVEELKDGSQFKGKIQCWHGGVARSEFKVISRSEQDQFRLRDGNGVEHLVKKENITIEQDEQPNDDKEQSEDQQEQTKQKPEFQFSLLNTQTQLRSLISSGVSNIWMVGPAGCGKTTIAKLAANSLQKDCYIMSCGIGTSSAEFIGYKYPAREGTKFAEYYSKPSIIVLDEFTALDPSVAQIANSALANDSLETTTGTVTRHPECIIIATSNTYGSGASRQYVSNNALDASTIDRFAGGILKVDYDKNYESQFDKEVVSYIETLREVIKLNNLRRIASTRSIINGQKLKEEGVYEWRDVLITNWEESEKQLLIQYLQTDKNTRFVDKYKPKVNSEQKN